MTDRFKPLFLGGNDLPGLKHLAKSVDHTPYDKGEVCTMPTAGQEENNQLIDGGSHITLSVTAKGNIYIFLEPGRKADMPASPELLDGW